MPERISFGQVAAVGAWAAYCILVTAIGASDHFELTLFLLFVPAQLFVGFLVPRAAMALAPVVLTILLGWFAYLAACPCREDGLAFFYALWTLYFALPGIVLVALGVTARKLLPPRAPGHSSP